MTKLTTTIPSVHWQTLSQQEQARLLTRPTSQTSANVRETVAGIIERVRAEGDPGVIELTAEIDNVRLEELRVADAEFEAAYDSLTRPQIEAIETAARQIRRFHQRQGVDDYTISTSPGVRCSRITRPLQAVGLYAPGGTAPLPSTVLMLAVPATLAQCPSIVLCTPPGRNGQVPAAILVAARTAGVKDVYKIGGAQAIAAMAFGTDTVPKVDKVFGPGNPWVTEAKLQVSLDADGAACDMPAGPSEVLIIADETASPAFVAADLLSQAEHGVDSQVLLLSTSEALMAEVQQEVHDQLEVLPRRDIALQSLQRSTLIYVSTLEEAVALSNRYAPEHLMIQTRAPRALLPDVLHAGSIFLGPWSPEAVGDYASGTNHVLPTYGFARAYSGLSLDSFRKRMTVQELSPRGLQTIGETVEILASLEGLQAHKEAVTKRLQVIADNPALVEDDATDVSALARPGVLTLNAYQSARSAVTSAKVFLDANENPYSPANSGSPSEEINRYPAPQPPSLVQSLSQLYDVEEDTLILGRGSDDIIDGLLRTFCEASKDAILVCPPTYGVYEVAAEIQGASVVSVPLKNDFSVNVEGILNAWEPRVKLVFICSPNNPTGTLTPLKTIETLCQKLTNRALVVVDEAYIEFTSSPSATTLLKRFDNLVVLRTLSKAWGLAGARCGSGISSPAVIELLQKVRAPYPVSTPSVDMVSEVLSPARREQFEAVLGDIIEERASLEKALAGLEDVLEIYPSQANFVLIRTRDAADFVRRCRKAGIIVRDRSNEPGLSNCVRITVGSSAQTSQLLAALNEERAS